MSGDVAPPECSAFLPCDEHPVEVAPSGPLGGLSVAVKDLFDVAGYRTGCGQPLRLEQAEPAEGTAPPVKALFDAGASHAGKTHLDELAYSVNGINAHYGAPRNAAAPGRITGGSSSGSAAAVVAGDADIGLGSDTGGSVRVPASYCGLFGIRPTHGAVSLERAMPLAPSFDTVGWLTRDAATLRMAGDVLLPAGDAGELDRLRVAGDAFARLDEAVRTAFAPAMEKLEAALPFGETLTLFPDDIDRRPVFRTGQAHEAWQSHGAWIETYQPKLGPGVGERFKFGSAVTRDAYEAADIERKKIRAGIDRLVEDGGAILLPAVPGPAPLRTTPTPELEAWRDRLQHLVCIASLTGHPQISIPAAKLDGAPLGLSIIGPLGADRALLRLAERIAALL